MSAVKEFSDGNALIAVDDNPGQFALDYNMAKDIAETLHRHYPGHLWGVNVKGDQGVLTIQNFMLSGERGYVLHLDKFFSASERDRACLRAAGEILERYKVRRGAMDLDNIASLPTYLGRVIGDIGK